MRQCREARYGIHRRANVVAHVVEKGGLGPVGVFCRVQSLRKRFAVFFQLPVLLLQLLPGQLLLHGLGTLHSGSADQQQNHQQGC